MVRKTKIIGTLGPACASPEGIDELVYAGLDVARLNFSHGDYDSHRSFAGWVRESAERHGRSVALLQDIQGPRIRVGTFAGGATDMADGDDLVLRQGDAEARQGEVYVDLLDAAIGLEVGHRVLLSDGLIRLEVTDIAKDAVEARVIEGGMLGDHKGVSFPDTRLDLPTVTPKDERDLEFGAEIGVDMVAASFVTSGQDIRNVRKLAGGLPVIAKIERSLAYLHLDDILSEAAGAMVARGDLGVELSLERVPMVQKDIIARTNRAGRISITATEMLESMTQAPRPSRAEVADVANAVIDGTDAVMLSAETAVGRFPTRAVGVMDIICREVESEIDYEGLGVEFLAREQAFPSAVAKACVDAVESLELPAILAFTESGSTARLISKYRPNAPIIAFTAIPDTYRQMALYWGVAPLMTERFDSTDEMIEYAARTAIDTGIVSEGDGVAMVAGIPPNEASSTNLLKLHIVGSGMTGAPRR